MPTTPPSAAARSERRPERRGRSIVIAVGVLLLAGVLPAASTGDSGPAAIRQAHTTAIACANVSLMPTAHDTAQVSGAIVCLVNAIRARYRLPRLAPNGALNQSALGHSNDMVINDYFSHNTPAGVTPAQRMRRHGATCARVCALGENIAWASGAYSTPAEIVAAWMGSPGHRANILDRLFRWEGVGVAPGSPLMLGHGSSGTTVTQDFAS